MAKVLQGQPCRERLYIVLFTFVFGDFYKEDIIAKQKRTIVGSPLTPSLLKELGAVDTFPLTSEDFDPEGNWQNTYRIWPCHGYRESGNDNVGYLRIRRTADSDDHLALNVYRKVVQTDALVHILEAKVKCQKNPLASPVAWELESRFVDANNNELPQLRKRENGYLTGAVNATGDWCLFEAVQRLAFDKSAGGGLSFNLLEGLSLSKIGHRLFYRGVYPTKIPGVNSLHCFVQLGSGILPYEYWLDDSHRLLMVISMNKAYILDNEAEKVIRRIIEKMRKSYRRRKA
ncbi:MAG: hypothetical protein ACETVZ_01815 [Phycisphaerae bacterium]